MMCHIPEGLLIAAAKDAHHLAMLRQLGLQSYVAVPLAARGRILGVITFVTAESGRTYDSDDLRLAEDLGVRAALALDNARLYRAAQQAHEKADEVLPCEVLAGKYRSNACSAWAAWAWWSRPATSSSDSGSRSSSSAPAGARERGGGRALPPRGAGRGAAPERARRPRHRRRAARRPARRTW